MSVEEVVKNSDGAKLGTISYRCVGVCRDDGVHLEVVGLQNFEVMGGGSL